MYIRVPLWKIECDYRYEFLSLGIGRARKRRWLESGAIFGRPSNAEGTGSREVCRSMVTKARFPSGRL